MESRINKNSWLRINKIAHRGVCAPGLIENTTEAFKLCVDKKVPIEIDVMLTKDDIPIIFHDFSLNRIFGINALVKDKTLNELKQLKFNNGENIPTLFEFLNLINGQVPILIEYKNNSIFNRKLERIVKSILQNYKGDVAIFSFNPLVVYWFKKNMPNYIRGQLVTMSHKATYKYNLDKITKPDFVAFDINDLPSKIFSNNRVVKLVWVATEKYHWQKIEKIKPDNVIYEERYK